MPRLARPGPQHPDGAGTDSVTTAAAAVGPGYKWIVLSNTFLSGLILFSMIYMYTPGAGFGPSSLFSDPSGGLSSRAVWILMGMLLGTIMWFNVWFIIWPAQLSMLKGQVPAEQLPAVRKKALLASRTNTFLSGPMLFGMLAPSHYGAINPITGLTAIALGMLAVFFAIKASSKVGASV